MQLDEARHQANVNAKARRLFDLGYVGSWSSDKEVEVVTPGGIVYRVRVFDRTCDCIHFARHGFCSHLWGWPHLMRGMAGEGACIAHA